MINQVLAIWANETTIKGASMFVEFDGVGNGESLKNESGENKAVERIDVREKWCGELMMMVSALGMI